MRKHRTLGLLRIPVAAGTSSDAAALDFVMDAFAHCKFIGYVQGAMPLLEKTNVAAMMDKGVVTIEGEESLQGFLAICRKLRLWEREPKVKADH